MCYETDLLMIICFILLLGEVSCITEEEDHMLSERREKYRKCKTLNAGAVSIYIVTDTLKNLLFLSATRPIVMTP